MINFDIKNLSFAELNELYEAIEKERDARANKQFDKDIEAIKTALYNFANHFPNAEIILPYINEAGCQENIDLTMYIDDLAFYY